MDLTVLKHSLVSSQILVYSLELCVTILLVKFQHGSISIWSNEIAEGNKIHKDILGEEKV